MQPDFKKIVLVILNKKYHPFLFYKFLIPLSFSYYLVS